ncbi:IclR family transcriptional regulator [Domibacillus sp. PGB-M46]|uniref:IclR family transcriptional regulator n=1 Tax=Domibacillus sp. PGB-M46 TaxID=2910255 RepID=UPI001F58F874|nr:IclR family transcriptional regulator [Domibacillus sp. PGB-M46]MCI2256448.1 IclR family transcriptional regulator [Domibacillus sp. PGB-M46]
MADKSTSQTLRRGLMVLDLFHGNNREYSVKELTDKMNISSTVTFRLVNTLVESGYLTKNSSNGKYRLGLNAYKLGLYANPNPKLQQVALPFLEKISLATKETVSLNVVDPLTLEGVCIASIESPHDIKFSWPVGLSKPVYRGASRKILLAFMEPSQQEQVFQRAISEGFTDIDQLKADLMEIKENGFAYTEGEVNEGALNVSAPVLSNDGLILAGVSIHCPVYRKNEQTVPTFSRLTMDAAKEIGDIMERNL